MGLNALAQAESKVISDPEIVVDGGVVRMRSADPATTLKWMDQEIPVWSATSGKQWESLIGVPYDTPPGVHWGELIGSQGIVQKFSITVRPGKYKSERLKVSHRKVKPKASDLKRIQAEQLQLQTIYERVSTDRIPTGSWTLPMQSRITSLYGTRRLYNGVHKNFHNGIDFRAPIGTPIQTPFGGVVELAQDLFFTGNTVILNHGYGVFSIYAHLNELRVQPGVKVDAGMVLGLSGQTGRANGPHLHWGIVVNRAKVNPLEFLKVIQ